jgi:multiple sugar transport system permease protein
MAESYRRSQWSNGLFILPYLSVFAVLLVFPLFWGAWLSLHKVDLFGPGRFVGLGNYARVLADPVFLQALRNTIIFVLVSVPTLVACSDCFWHLRSTRRRGRPRSCAACSSRLRCFR